MWNIMIQMCIRDRKIADVIKETENNKADRQEQYFFRTDQLTVGYDGKPLIREINIQLKKGEILTLIGPNGAGKSTISSQVISSGRIRSVSTTASF